MNCKKIIAKILLLSSIIGVSGCFSKTQAKLSGKDWDDIHKIEKKRHNKNCSKSELIKDVSNLKNSNSNIKLYYWSILYKLESEEIKKRNINFNDEKEYKKEFFATLLYRALSYKIDKREPIDTKLITSIKNFLNNKIKDYNSFKSLNEMDRVNIVRVCLICSKYNFLQEPELNEILEKIGNVTMQLFNEQSAFPKPLKLLVTFSKIPQKGDIKRLAALNAVINSFEGKDEETKYKNAAEDEQGREALIVYSMIPGEQQKTTGVKYLNAVINHFGGYAEAAEDEQGREALIVYSMIPGEQQKTTGVKYLNAVINHFGGYAEAAKDEQGREALIVYSMIPGEQQKTTGIKYLNAVINHFEGCDAAAKDEQGREALIALGKIQHDRNEELKALNAVIGYFEKEFKNPIENKQYREALIVYSMIPGEQQKTQGLIYLTEVITHFRGYKIAVADKQGQEALIVYSMIPGEQQKTQGLIYLTEVITHFRGYKIAVADKQGQEALIVYSMIPGEQQKTTGVKYLNEVINHFGGYAEAAEDEQGREALIALGKIPQEDQKKRLAGLNAVIDHFKNNYNNPIEDKQYREALIVYSMIPGEQQKTTGIKYLNEVIERLGGKNEATKYKNAAEDEQGREALIALGKIPHDTGNQLAALGAVIGYFEKEFKNPIENKQYREALIALGKIQHNRNEELKALNAVINHFGGYAEAAEDEQGREALIALGKIPHDTGNQLAALNEVINHFRGKDEATKYTNAAKDEQGREALIALGKIPHNAKKQLAGLNAVINYYEEKNNPTLNGQYEQALMAYASIPGADIDAKIEKLKILSQSNNTDIKQKVCNIAKNIINHLDENDEYYYEYKKTLYRIITSTRNPRFQGDGNLKRGNQRGTAKKTGRQK